MRNKKIYLIGAVIIALAALIVLLCVALPMAVHKNKMESLLEAMASSKRISVGDPLFETGDIFGNKGNNFPHTYGDVIQRLVCCADNAVTKVRLFPSLP